MKYKYLLVVMALLFTNLHSMEADPDCTENAIIEAVEDFNEPEMLVHLVTQFIAQKLITDIESGADYESFLNPYELNGDVEEKIISVLPRYAGNYLWSFCPIEVVHMQVGDIGMEYDRRETVLLENDELLELYNYPDHDSDNTFSNIKIWDISSKECIKDLNLPKIIVQKFLISKNYKTLFLWCNDNSVLVYNMKKGKLVTTIKQIGTIKAISLACDDKYICIGVTGQKSIILIKDKDTGNEISSFEVGAQYDDIKSINDIIVIAQEGAGYIESWKLYANEGVCQCIPIAKFEIGWDSIYSSLGSNFLYIIRTLEPGTEKAQILTVPDLKCIHTYKPRYIDPRLCCSADSKIFLLGESKRFMGKLNGLSLVDPVSGKVIRKLDLEKELLSSEIDLSSIWWNRFDISCDNNFIVVYGGKSNIAKICLQFEGGLRSILEQIKLNLNNKKLSESTSSKSFCLVS